MRYTDLLEEQAKQITVVYGGRFQPMHAGHYALYSKLAQEFGADNVFIATMFGKKQQAAHAAGNYGSDPFTFEEKAYIIKKMFGISNVVNTSPYQPDLSKMGRNPETSAVVLAFSAKDAGRLKTGGVLHPMPQDKKSLETYFENGSTHRAYIKEMPIEKGGMSATDFRTAMASNSPAEEKQKTFVEFFGKFDQEIFDFIEERVSK